MARADVTADPWSAQRLVHHLHNVTEPTVAVTRGDARTLVGIATRADLTAPERVVVSRIAARIDDYDAAVER